MRAVVFDLDGTLTESKTPIDAEMAGLLARLLRVARVAVISGGGWLQFDAQLLARLPASALLRNLSILAACGTQLRAFEDGWVERYRLEIPRADRDRIVTALKDSFGLCGFDGLPSWGERIEDRGSQVTLSALGQRAPLEEKKRWDLDAHKRQAIAASARVLLPDFSVRLGGTTSIDVTPLGVDKAFGIAKLESELDMEAAEMLFVGDALGPGGNDQPVRSTGAICIEVRDPGETKRVIEAVLACLG